jgi:hypothetical protein
MILAVGPPVRRPRSRPARSVASTRTRSRSAPCRSPGRGRCGRHRARCRPSRAPARRSPRSFRRSPTSGPPSSPSRPPRPGTPRPASPPRRPPTTSSRDAPATPTAPSLVPHFTSLGPVRVHGDKVFSPDLSRQGANRRPGVGLRQRSAPARPRAHRELRGCRAGLPARAARRLGASAPAWRPHRATGAYSSQSRTATIPRASSCPTRASAGNGPTFGPMSATTGESALILESLNNAVGREPAR